MTTNEITIVGFAPSWEETPWEKAGELWGMNALHKIAPDKPWNVWFQLHDIDIAHPEDKEEHLAWLIQSGLPVYMFEEHLAKYPIPNGVPFPRQAVMEALGTSYFTNTVSWMVGLAILQQRPKISIYGIDMAQDCIAPETKVLTSELRYVPAEKISVGDTVLGFDEHPGVEGKSFRKWREAEVLEANRLIRPSYRIHLEDGTEVVASAGHQWLTYSEHSLKWRRTDELVTDMHRRPSRIVRYFDTWEEDRSWAGGYLAAAFDGEGHLSQIHRNGRDTLALGFAQRDNAMRAEVDTALAHLGFSVGSSQNGSVANYVIKGGKAEILRFLGTVRPRRLLDGFDAAHIGITQRREAPAVLFMEYLGEQEVIGFKTSTKTFVAEGLASHNSEYQHQRPSCEYLIGLAQGRGIDVYVPDTSDLLKTPFLYGIEEEKRNMLVTKVDARVKDLQGRLTQMQQQSANQQAAIHQLQGAIEDAQYWRRAWLHD